MRYLDICSGISAPTVAWKPLGWTAAGYSEIEKFPRAVLAERFGAVPVDWDHRHTPGSNVTPLFGDFTQIEAHHVGPVDLLVGGTPCQDFSVAGLRKGLAGDRGNLTLEFLRLADRIRPRWLVWENVPGVLSINGGRAFGSFLGGMGELGYGFAYRVLDAQFVRVDGYGRAVPQRRRRVFVVGHIGDWRSAAAVLFDRESLSGNPPPRRQAGQGTACDVAPSLVISGRGVERAGETRRQDPVVALRIATDDVSLCLSSHPNRSDSETMSFVAHPLRGEGFDAGEGGTGRGTPLAAITFGAQMSTPSWAIDVCDTLQAKNPKAVAFDLRGREGGAQFEGPHETANIRAASGGSSRSYVAQQWAVRRLTPTECSRLQGFSDDHCAITYRGKPAADGPQYKALGNSMAVNVMRWIGRRIEMVEQVQDRNAA